MGYAKKLIDANVRLSRLFDSLLPGRLRQDGNKYFIRELLPPAFAPGTTVYDLGGGSRPCISREEKERLGLTVIGLDISAEELAAAPPNTYDSTIAADLCTFVGKADADAVVCQATLGACPQHARRHAGPRQHSQAGRTRVHLRAVPECCVRAA